MMGGCAFYTAVPAWLQVLQVLVQMGFMVTLAVAAVMVARQYGRHVDVKIAERAAHEVKHATAAASVQPAANDISVEPFVD